MRDVAEGAAAATPSRPQPPVGTGRIETADLGPFDLDDGSTLPGLTVA